MSSESWFHLHGRLVMGALGKRFLAVLPEKGKVMVSLSLLVSTCGPLTRRRPSLPPTFWLS